MAGLRDIYEYQLINEKGEIEMQGLAKDLAGKLWVDQNNIYTSWKKGSKLLREYKVNRIQVKPKTKKKEEYEELYNLALEELEFFDRVYTYRRIHEDKNQWDKKLREKLEKKKEKNDE